MLSARSYTATPDFFCFFRVSSFDCSGDHRDLHSFPTRRSSDLFTYLIIGIALLGLGAGGVLIATWPAPRPDRKSTRLNSSHTVISYAVFCLKKKKNSS